MLIIIAEFMPLLFVFLLGYSLKRIGLLAYEDGDTMFRLLFYVGLPVLIFATLRNTELSTNLIWLAILPIFIIIATLLVTFMLRRNALRQFDYKTFGALVAGGIILNTGFLIPFVEQFYSNSGLARLLVVDTVNGLLMFSVVYLVMSNLSRSKTDKNYVFQKIITSPSLWAVVVALIFNVNKITLPALADQSINLIAGVISTVILLALGLKFRFALARPKYLLPALGLRFGLGGMIGLAFVYVFGLDGINAHIVILTSMAPIGFNLIPFTAFNNLDTDLAAAQASIGLLTGLVALPIMLYSLPLLYPL